MVVADARATLAALDNTARGKGFIQSTPLRANAR